MDNIRIPINFYSISQALEFLESLDCKMSKTWLRKRMRDEKMEIYKAGNSEFVTEADLYKLSLIPKVKRGPKPKQKV